MNITALLRAIPELLFCTGALLVPIALGLKSWQDGLLGVGLLLVTISFAVRGAIHNAADKRRGQ